MAAEPEHSASHGKQSTSSCASHLAGLPLLLLAVGFQEKGTYTEVVRDCQEQKMDRYAFGARWTAIVCAFLMVSAPVLPAEPVPQEPQATAPQAEPTKIPNDQLDSLIAPIALYPDPMLAQVLVASTYPLELIQLQQWLSKNPGLKDKELADAVKKQPWDPSIQSMAALPEVVKLLADDIQWTTDLGNAFLAQQNDVMEAAQRMRKKAQEKGNLKSTDQQKVETKVVETKQVIVIEQANPQVVYVPSYNPTVVYGPPVYPYPPVAYPPPGYYAAGLAISFGVGMAMGAAWGGGWGYGSSWGGHNDITINNNNNFNRNTNVNGGNRTNQVNGGNRGGSTWQHNPQHRGGAPYSDRGTANKYGGTARGDSTASRQNNARQRQSGTASNRPAGGASDRPSASTNDRGGNRGSGGDRPSAGTSDRGGNRSSSGGGGDRVGDRSTSSGASSNKGAFGGSSASGSSARQSSSRGAASTRSSGGGRSHSGGGGGGRRR
jgi:Protein of unknown function (DUF3300)